ncbi:MAG: COX15/CtaA family protein [Novosphingobium sp.]|uniref:COX15/CtaA family protein n=1 Tax=Novosphingobium sp. TaxID=1874826 RepID=UPI0032BDBD5F
MVHAPLAPPPYRPLLLARWLWVVVSCLIVVLVVGGITRLTESGLSITDWKPVTGVIPPLDQSGWLAEFEAYKLIPQYTQMNGPAGMTLEEYKWIYFWEWLHRFLVRMVLGTSFVLPLAWFWLRGAIPPRFKPRLLGLLALGGAQAVVGWLMVRSGLSAGADVKVSHYWLATHLMLALGLLGWLAWTALDLAAVARGQKPVRPRGIGLAALAAVFVQLFYGALLAGLRAGPVAGGGWLNWDAWPLMQGKLVPGGIDWDRGLGHVLLADPFLIHFIHRWWAWIAVGVLIVLARRLRQHDRRISIAIHSAFGFQIILGIAAVMSGIALWLAALHQLTGALLLIATIWGAHRIASKNHDLAIG